MIKIKSESTKDFNSLTEGTLLILQFPGNPELYIKTDGYVNLTSIETGITYSYSDEPFTIVPNGTLLEVTNNGEG